MRGVLRTVVYCLTLGGIFHLGVCAGAAAGLPFLSGTWDAVETYSGYLDNTILGTVRGQLEVHFFEQIVQSGSAISLSARYCAVRLASPIALLKAEVPEAALATLAPVNRMGVLERTADGTRFVQESHAQVLGAHVTGAEPLPTGADDPRVFDEDGDGHPGVTLRVSLGTLADLDLYLAVRLECLLVGAVVSPDRIEGEIDWKAEVSLLGGSLPVARTSHQAGVDVTFAESRFVLVRIDPACGCSDVLSESALLPSP